jgi:ArsR family transcriptional regulator, arsenate/arsenite/antimonite-responsive transcriptional repressor
VHSKDVDLISIYECMCDRTRLRLLHTLSAGPLCVADLQEILREPQVKVSKHLGFLKRRGMVQSERQGNRMIYRLPAKRPSELSTNLACLQDCVREHPVFRHDSRRAEKLRFRPRPLLPAASRKRR